MPARLLMISHGETAYNAGRDQVQGWLDDPLDPSGRREVVRLGRRLRLEGVQRLLTSDLKRAAQTAALIGREIRLRPQPSRSFRPWFMGQLQGMASEKARPMIRNFAENPGTKIPGGESLNDFKGRLFPALARLLSVIRKEELTVALVTHSRDLSLTNDWLAADGRAEKMKLTNFLRDDVGPGALMEIVPDGESWKSRWLDKGGH
jgi:broad specificity phosphatase PhoE